MKKTKHEKRFKWWVVLVVLIFVLLALILSLNLNLKQIPLENTVVVKIEGPILSKPSLYSFTTATYSEEIIKLIEDISKKENIKAIIFEINSPGGSAVASSEIAEAIKKLNKTKVAVIREMGTSGAYWIASANEYIIAHPLSITGSIGVSGSYLEISGLLERFNITYQNLTTGKYKDTMSPFRKLEEEEKEMILKKLKIIHNHFIEEVAKNRNLDKEEVERLANGMFYLGTEAKELKLVDALGSREDAIKYIEEKLGIKARVKEYKKPRGFFERLVEIQAITSFWIGRGIGASFLDKNLIFFNYLDINT